MRLVRDARLALLFPGQGSQHVGMGDSLRAASRAAEEIYRRADELLDMPLSRLCFEGPEAELQATINQQPATFVTSMAWLEALREHWAAGGRELRPLLVAGHSLGEFTAAVAAGSLTFEEGLRLVRERGRYMEEAGRARPGGMAAVFGLNEAELRTICAQASSGGHVDVAALNGDGQSVISGEMEPLERAIELVGLAGARKVVRLPITIASHSPLMRPARVRMNDLLRGLPIRDPLVPVVGNVTGELLRSGEAVYAELRDQLTASVRWGKSIQTMKSEGATVFLEVGPGHILTRLVRRIDSQLAAISVSDEREGLLSPGFGAMS